MSDAQISRDFLARYHAAVINALPEAEAEKFRMKLGANLFQPFVDSLDGHKLGKDELKDRLERYLREDLKMTEGAEVQLDGDQLTVAIRGCHLCHGNDILRSQQAKPCCPFAPGMNRALSKATGSGSRLQGVDKLPGQTGACNLTYTVSL